MIYVFLANGFEEIEALCVLDLLRRAGVPTKTVGIDEKIVMGSHKIPVVCDMEDIELTGFEDFDMIILPGGLPGANNLDASEVVEKFINRAVDEDKFISAICAAPFILGKRGILNGKRATCYPGFENELIGAKISKKSVVTDGNITTAKGMGAALGFATELVRIFCGEEKAKQLSEAVMDE
jgi:4-methyl-5(b-hydroxyethyl)-thiazole monophosphate biosynthesis